MKYAHIITALGVAGAQPLEHEFEADNDDEAVDATRAHLESDLPDRGGDFEVVVTASEPFSYHDAKGKPCVRPAGEVSRFTVRHEPKEHMRQSVEDERAEAAIIELRAKQEAEMRARIIAELSAKGVVIPADVAAGSEVSK